MKNQIKTITSLMAAFTLIGTPIVLAHNPNGKPDPMNASLEPLKGAQFEQSYLQQMIQHHRGGIEMAKLVSDHTKRAELREFADKMISVQEQEITQMTRWSGDWYKTSPKKVANEKANGERPGKRNQTDEELGAILVRSSLTNRGNKLWHITNTNVVSMPASHALLRASIAHRNACTSRT